MERVEMKNVYLGIKVFELSNTTSQIEFVIITKEGFLNSLTGKKVTIYKDLETGNYLYLDENDFDLFSNSEYKYLYSMRALFECYLLKIDQFSDFSMEQKVFFLSSVNKIKNIANLSEEDLQNNFDSIFETYCYTFGNPVIKEQEELMGMCNYTTIKSSKKVKKFRLIQGKLDTKED